MHNWWAKALPTQFLSELPLREIALNAGAHWRRSQRRLKDKKTNPWPRGILHFKSNYRTRHSTSVWRVVNHADSSTGKNGRHDADNYLGSSHWQQFALPMPHGCCGNYLNSNPHFFKWGRYNSTKTGSPFVHHKLWPIPDQLLGRWLKDDCDD